MTNHELTFTDLYAATFALGICARLITVARGRWDQYVFDDTDGRASAALGQWRTGALVRARDHSQSIEQLKRISRVTLAVTGTKEGDTGTSIRTAG
jgi:hypothetical protein